MASIAPMRAPGVATIETVLSRLDLSGAPGAVIGLAFNGEVIYRGGRGLADAQSPLRLGTQTRLPLGAISNHFVALTFILLCQECLADLDAPIGSYVRGLHPATASARMRHLLGHVSGIRDCHEIAFQLNGFGARVSSADLLGLYAHVDDADAPALDRWVYNHGGYLLVGKAIEEICGKALEEVLFERIFLPAGMFDTELRRHHHGMERASASAHSRTEFGLERSRLGAELAGEGGIVSTVDDMLRWMARLRRAPIGGATARGAMQTPQILNHGASTSYGLGWMMKRRHGHDLYWHIAGAWGASADILHAPALGLDIVVLANTSDLWATSIGEMLFDACIGAAAEPEQTPAIGVDVSGLFRSRATGRLIELSTSQERGVVSIDAMASIYAWQRSNLLRSSGPGRFLNRELEIVGKRDQPLRLIYRDFGAEDEFELIERRTEDASAQSVMGAYRSESADVNAAITREDDEVCLATEGPFGSVRFRLTPLTATMWRAQSDQMIEALLTFAEAGFSYSAERLKRLFFSRSEISAP